jgi:hypothetical protein
MDEPEAILNPNYVAYSSTQEVYIDGVTTRFPIDWQDMNPDEWNSIGATAPFGGWMRITIGAKVVNRNTDASTAYIGFRMDRNGEITDPSNYRAVGTVGGGTTASRSRIFAVSEGDEIGVIPAFRASSYSKDKGVTAIEAGSLELEFFRG